MDSYAKTTEFTSAASSLMIVVNHFNPDFELSKENEFRIWLSSVNLPTRASSIYGLANFAKKQGLNPHIIYESEGYEYPDYRFKGYKKVEIEQAEFSHSLHKREAKSLGIKIERKKIDGDLIETLVGEGKVLLVRMNVGVFRDSASISNYVVVNRKKEGLFEIIDPKMGPVKATKEQIQEALDTLSSKKKRHSKMIVFG